MKIADHGTTTSTGLSINCATNSGEQDCEESFIIINLRWVTQQLSFTGKQDGWRRGCQFEALKLPVW
jgi:hypothetical protein